jgi:hypothetical protein
LEQLASALDDGDDDGASANAAAAAAAKAQLKAELEAKSASSRLDFLLKQTDLFSHFVKGNSALACVMHFPFHSIVSRPALKVTFFSCFFCHTCSDAAAKHRRAHSEQEEDQSMVESAEEASVASAAVAARLDVQPSSTFGLDFVSAGPIVLLLSKSGPYSYRLTLSLSAQSSKA